jgi:hypothetical protein
MRTQAIRPMLAGSVLLVGALIGIGSARAQDASGTRAVPTYEAVGLYWSSPGASSAGCEVKFRAAGTSAWTQGLAMWFDASRNECRGSLVHLAPGTSYEAQLSLPGQGAAKALTFTTWANQFPVARTVSVGGGSGTLNITEGGSASGYVVYDGGGATLDAGNNAQYNVSVNASYVIVRNLKLVGAKQDAVRVGGTVHDVVIEDNEMSGWGRTRDGTWGADMDSAVRVVCSGSQVAERITIQRNKMHSPRYPANSWSDGHPAGPQAITMSYCGGNHVMRHNEVYTTNGNYFNDGFGGEDNFSDIGFPNADSDIYGNKISHTWDDGIEAEGANKNVRIWGNYLDNTATGVATTLTAVGPVYIFRNVYNRSRFFQKSSSDSDDRQPFFKSGSSPDFGNGRRYIFHNTMLQAQQSGATYTLGAGAGMGGTGSSQLVNNTVSMNNIYHLWKPNSAIYQSGSGNTFQNDMFNGSYGAAVVSGINATPSYASGHGWQSEAGGQYALAQGTAGYDQGVRIANFNDSFSGSGPDVGAAEAGAPAMKFGLAAADPVGSATVTTPAPTPPVANVTNPAARGNGLTARYAASNRTAFVPVATPAAPTTPTTPVTPPSGGAVAISATMDSSSYAVNVGQSVTFTVRLLASGAAPTGTVNFQASGTSIANCAPVSVSGSQAVCTTTALASGTYAITGVYSGDANYSAGIAGPITQTVR